LRRPLRKTWSRWWRCAGTRRHAALLFGDLSSQFGPRRNGRPRCGLAGEWAGTSLGTRLIGRPLSGYSSHRCTRTLRTQRLAGLRTGSGRSGTRGSRGRLRRPRRLRVILRHRRARSGKHLTGARWSGRSGGNRSRSGWGRTRRGSGAFADCRCCCGWRCGRRLRSWLCNNRFCSCGFGAGRQRRDRFRGTSLLHGGGGMERRDLLMCCLLYRSSDRRAGWRRGHRRPGGTETSPNRRSQGPGERRS
jgi:hypothetical protein